jgi:predicted ribosome quality control (RQC) complex YloA/Tae2 family protein
MLLHYYTLHHIAAELRSVCGWILTECFTQERNTLHLVLERYENGNRENSKREERVIEFNLDSRNGAVFLRSEFNRARKNTLDLFPDLTARILTDVQLIPNERVLVLRFPPFTLSVMVFSGWNANVVSSDVHDSPSSPSNAVLTDEDGIIRAAFKMPQHLVGTPLILQMSQSRALQDFPPETPLLTALAQCNVLLGKYYAREVLARYNQAHSDSDSSSDSDSDSDNVLDGASSLALPQVQLAFAELERLMKDVRVDCLNAERTFIVRTADGATSPPKPLLSFIPLLGSTVERETQSVSEAVQTRIGLAGREARFHGLYAAALARFKEAERKAERALQHIERDTDGSSRAIERKLWAELLMSQQNVHERGLEHLTVQSWDGEELTIRLNPAKSLLENAEEFFAKAASARETLKKREVRKRRTAENLAATQALLRRLQTVTTERELETLMKTPNATSTTSGNQSPAAAESTHQKTTRFREFPLQDGYTLYVGKTAADNDELTLRFAKPHDYWLHARGVPGSHAVLRGTGAGASAKDKKPPKHVLEQAAAIAAYFSKARSAKLTPVAYTQKKYIRKPKGAAVGAVIIEREEVLMARPHVPAGLLTGGDEEA